MRIIITVLMLDLKKSIFRYLITYTVSMCEKFSPSAAVVVKQMFYVHKSSLSLFQPVYFPLMGIGILSE